MILVTGSAGQIGSYVLESFENAYGVDLKPFKDLNLIENSF